MAEEKKEPTKEDQEQHLQRIGENLSVWFDGIHQLFNNQPIFILLRVQMGEDGKQRFLGIEGVAPSSDSLEFMTGLKLKNLKNDNPLVG